MKKRGISHIEMIIAFLLFIFAVFFLFYFNSQSDNSIIVENQLHTISDSFLQKESINLTSYTIILNPQNILTETIAVNIFSSSFDNVRVENYSGFVLISEKVSYIVYFDWSDDNGKLIYVMLSPNYSSSNMVKGKPPLNETYYNISSVSAGKVLSESKILELNKSYWNNYEDTKKFLNISSTLDFSFALIFSQNDKIEAQKKISGNKESFSLTQRKEVLRADSSLSFADIIITIW